MFIDSANSHLLMGQFTPLQPVRLWVLQVLVAAYGCNQTISGGSYHCVPQSQYILCICHLGMIDSLGTWFVVGCMNVYRYMYVIPCTTIQPKRPAAYFIDRRSRLQYLVSYNLYVYIIDSSEITRMGNWPLHFTGDRVKFLMEARIHTQLEKFQFECCLHDFGLS